MKYLLFTVLLIAACTPPRTCEDILFEKNDRCVLADVELLRITSYLQRDNDCILTQDSTWEKTGLDTFTVSGVYDKTNFSSLEEALGSVIGQRDSCYTYLYSDFPEEAITSK